MNIIISSKNFKITEAHREYVETKIKHLEHFDHSLYQVRVELDADKKEREGNQFRIEVWVEGKPHIKAGAYEKNLYSAVDVVVPKLAIQLKKEKDKRITKRKRAL